MKKATALLVGIGFFLVALILPTTSAQQPTTPVKVKEVIGLTGIRNNTAGNLRIENRILIFAHGKEQTEISTVGISDIVTGADSERAVGGTIGMMSMAAPYGGGRFLSLFRKKIDTLCVQYREPNGSLHGAIFTMPVGGAETLKGNLVAEGATAAAVTPPTASAGGRGSSPHKDETAPTSVPAPVKVHATAVQVRMIESEDVEVPAEFRIALYENLVERLHKEGKFQHVYRDGETGASNVSDLVVLHSTIRGFKQGSERARQVTTVSGTTSINVHCLFAGADGNTFLERDLNGKVRFFGGNLRVTYDFAKKAAHVAESFSTTDAAK